MIRRSYSGPSERAKSRELGPTRSGFYLSERLVPSPLRHFRVHFASTWRHSRDQWDQAFPVFALFRFRVLYWTQTEELKRGRPGNEAKHSTWLKLPVKCVMILTADYANPIMRKATALAEKYNSIRGTSIIRTLLEYSQLKRCPSSRVFTQNNLVCYTYAQYKQY